ncbi:hypothetical protein BP6252_00739 [Coleophoma cylindrospora]|uniref:Uncharacterized protein n=1 Tax=Coleophoma cylindrospora TaxID=1849047 RepID=A0A3D8SQY6_9HELO|nr:hypothetical protein BP6252_00739 [Coleophoma cylindrospora]
MAVIWGLDLKEMQWGKFKGSYMFNQEYHLRRTKMIVYQFAMILCVVSESVGTAALSDYVDEQDGISTRSGGRALIHNNDIVGIMSYNIFIGIAVATIFGSGFFFDLFWPERKETKGVRLAWKISAIAVCLGALGDALALTVIVATHAAFITGVSATEAATLIRNNSGGKPTLVYRHNPYCVASVVILWLGVVATFASTYILFKSHKHDDALGPKSAQARRRDEEAYVGTQSASNINPAFAPQMAQVGST